MASTHEIKAAEQFINAALVDYKEPSSFIKNICLLLKNKQTKRSHISSENFTIAMLLFCVNQQPNSLFEFQKSCSANHSHHMDVVVDKLFEIAENRLEYSTSIRTASLYVLSQINPNNCKLFGANKRGTASSWNLTHKISLYKAPSLMDFRKKEKAAVKTSVNSMKEIKQLISSKSTPPIEIVEDNTSVDADSLECLFEVFDSVTENPADNVFSIVLLTNVLLSQNQHKRVIETFVKEAVFDYMLQVFKKPYQHFQSCFQDSSLSHKQKGEDIVLANGSNDKEIEESFVKNETEWANILELNQFLSLYYGLSTHNHATTKALLSADQNCFERLAFGLYDKAIEYLKSYSSKKRKTGNDLDPWLLNVEISVTLIVLIVEHVIYLHGNNLLGTFDNNKNYFQFPTTTNLDDESDS